MLDQLSRPSQLLLFWLSPSSVCPSLSGLVAALAILVSLTPTGTLQELEETARTGGRGDTGGQGDESGVSLPRFRFPKPNNVHPTLLLLGPE